MFTKFFKFKNTTNNNDKTIKKYVKRLYEYYNIYNKKKNYSPSGRACDFEKKLYYKLEMFIWLINSQETFCNIYNIIDNKSLEDTPLISYLIELRSKRFIQNILTLNKYDLYFIKSNYIITVDKLSYIIKNAVYVMKLFSNYIHNNYDNCSTELKEIIKKLPRFTDSLYCYDKEGKMILHECCIELMNIKDNKYGNMLEKFYNSPENTILFLIDSIDSQKNEMDKIQKDFESCMNHIESIYDCCISY